MDVDNTENSKYSNININIYIFQIAFREWQHEDSREEDFLQCQLYPWNVLRKTAMRILHPVLNMGEKRGWFHYQSLWVHAKLIFNLMYCFGKSQVNDGFGSRNWKGKLGLFLTSVLMLWGCNHFDGHIWRWVIVPLDLAQSFWSDLRSLSLKRVYHAIT